MSYLLVTLVFIQSLVLCLWLTPLSIRLARIRGIVDRPGERKIHTESVPLLGGAAIFVSVTLVIVFDLFVYILAERHFLLPAGLDRYLPLLSNLSSQLTLLMAGGFAIHLLGLADDLFKNRMTFRFKLPVQAVIAIFIAAAGFRTHFMPGHILDIVITVLWITGMTNSYNLLDNMDGLSAGVTVISAAILLTVALLQGQVFYALMLAALAGAALGFLRYNFHPARVFMGDSGSLFIGYLFGVLTVQGSYVLPGAASHLPVVLPLLVLSIPLYDTFSVMFIRWRQGRPLFIGDKCHFSHRLVELGMSQRGAVIFIYLVCFVVGITATLLPHLSFAGSLVVLFQTFTIYLLITILISTGCKKELDKACE